jgi:hypothetical protein
VETTSVGDGPVEVLLVEVMNEEGAELDGVEGGWTVALTALQVPKAALQPASQKMLVLPHHPYSLQQLPNVDPEHVKP